MAYAAPQLHWYDSAGRAVHQVPKKDGKGMKNTTITEAKIMGLFPSVTSILKSEDKPQLNSWKEDQCILAALTITPPRQPGEEDKAFLKRVKADAFKQVVDAADHGTDIHKALELYFSGQEYDPQWKVEVEAVQHWMLAHNVQVLQTEQKLVSPRYGCAGTTDLLVSIDGGMGIGDYKTKKTTPAKTDKDYQPFAGQATQVAAYHMMKYGEIDDKAQGFNLFISSVEPGRLVGHFYDAETLREEWVAFEALCSVWRIRNKFDPRQIGVGEPRWRAMPDGPAAPAPALEVAEQTGFLD